MAEKHGHRLPGYRNRGYLKYNKSSRSFRPMLYSTMLRVYPLFLLLHLSVSAFAQSPATDPPYRELITGKPFIYHIEPDKRGGKAYKLVYVADAPVATYWNFKTDFDNKFLLRNKYIDDHRFIDQKGNVVFTENRYATVPDAVFIWETKLKPFKYRMEFRLTNPHECGQRFHYGHIQLIPLNGATKVSQVAYFDFHGATLWAHYPFAGGMSEFLRYTARWEQQTVRKFKEKYTGIINENIHR